MFNAKDKLNIFQHSKKETIGYDYCAQENETAWSILSIYLKNGRTDCFLDFLSKIDFIPVIYKNTGKTPISLLSLAVSLNRVEEFMALTKLAVKNAQNPNEKLQILKNGFPKHCYDIDNYRYKKIDEFINQKPSPLLCCFEHDNPECLAALLDEDEFAELLLKDEPTTVPEGEDFKERTDNSGAEKSLLFQANRSRAGKCIALLCSIEELSKNLLTDKVGIYEESASSYRKKQESYEENGSVGFSMFEYIICNLIEVERGCSYSDDQKVKDYFFAIGEIISKPELISHKNQEGTGANWAEMITAHLLNARFVVRHYKELVDNWLIKCVKEYNMEFNTGIKFYEHLLGETAAAEFQSLIFNDDFDKGKKKKKLKI